MENISKMVWNENLNSRYLAEGNFLEFFSRQFCESIFSLVCIDEIRLEKFSGNPSNPISRIDFSFVGNHEIYLENFSEIRY